MINVSFFSYKGGSGRTSLLFNTLPYLANELNATNREPIIVIDLDIDSKGFSYLIDRTSLFNSIQVLRGGDSIGFRSRETDIGKHPFFKGLVPIGYDIGLPREASRSVLFVSAKATTETNKYLSNSDNFDAANVSLRDLNRMCQDLNCKAIVMDAPAGEQVACKAALSISKKIVTVMRITRQFRLGTYDFLREKNSDFSNKEFIITPNVVPREGNRSYIIEQFMDEICKRTGECLVGNNKLNLDMLADGMNGINEVNLFKFEEKSLYKEKQIRELLDDEKEASEKYHKLAKEIAL